jgi:hypothetical protein
MCFASTDSPHHTLGLQQFFFFFFFRTNRQSLVLLPKRPVYYATESDNPCRHAPDTTLSGNKIKLMKGKKKRELGLE